MSGEDKVFLASGDKLGNNAIMRVQTVTAARRRIGRIKDDKTGLPAARQYGRGDTDPLGIVTISLMERGQLPYRSVDLVGLCIVRVKQEGDIDFHRHCGLKWQSILGYCTQNGLATDDENIRISRDPGCRPQHVLQLPTIHAT